MYAKFGYIVSVFSARGQRENDIDVQVKLVGDDDPVFARLINDNNTIGSPEDGTPCIVTCVNDDNNLWVRTINKDAVMRISQGEKVICDAAGNMIYFRKDNGMLIETVKGNIDITAAGNINIIGDVNITGNLTVSGTSDLTGTTTIETKPFIAHTHSGVTTGPANTGVVT